MAEPHDADQRLHHFLEPAVPAEQHEDESEQAVEHAAPGLRDAPSGQVADAEPRGVGQCGRDGDGPEHEVDEKVELHPGRQVLGPSLERRLSCRKLPARDALVQHVLEKRANRDRPEQDDAVARAADGGGDDVTRADAGGRDDQAWAGELQKTEGSGPSRRHSRSWVVW